MSKPPHTKKQDVQKVHWAITINNPTDQDEALFDNDQKFKFATFGREHYGPCPDGWKPTPEQEANGQTTWTPHLQGMVSCIRKMRFAEIKKMFPRAHISPCDINYIAYCQKPEDGGHKTVVTHGVMPLKGGDATKVKWAEAKQLALANKVADIEASIFIRYYGNLQRIANDNRVALDSIPKLKNEWHWGPTGTGKSRSVRDRFPNAFIKDTTEWWNGYDGQPVVIIEDLDKYHVKLGYYLKIWSDHYAFPGNLKSLSARMIRPKRVIVTSNYDPCAIWSDEETYKPLMRRFKMVEYKENGDIYVNGNFVRLIA